MRLPVRAWQTRDLRRADVDGERPLSASDRELAGYYQPINPRQAVGYFIERIAGSGGKPMTLDVDRDGTRDCADTCLDADGDGYGDAHGDPDADSSADRDAHGYAFSKVIT